MEKNTTKALPLKNCQKTNIEELLKEILAELKAQGKQLQILNKEKGLSSNDLTGIHKRSDKEQRSRIIP